jgi:hypothetical protein
MITESEEVAELEELSREIASQREARTAPRPGRLSAGRTMG